MNIHVLFYKTNFLIARESGSYVRHWSATEGHVTDWEDMRGAMAVVYLCFRRLINLLYFYSSRATFLT